MVKEISPRINIILTRFYSAYYIPVVFFKVSHKRITQRANRKHLSFHLNIELMVSQPSRPFFNFRLYLNLGGKKKKISLN